MARLIDRPCRFGSTLFGVVAAISFAIAPAPAAAIAEEEWVTTFVRFVDWPSSPVDNVIVVCQPHEAVPLALNGVQIGAMTLHVVQLKRAGEAKRCHVFSAMSQQETQWRPWLASFRSRPILVMGPGSRFCETGGTICVVKDDATGAEKYRVNLDAVARSGLKVRMPLLRHQRVRRSNAE